MKLTIDLKFFTYSVIAFVIAYSIISGFAQKYVKFAAVENEMGCFFLAATMGVICLFASFERIKK